MKKKNIVEVFAWILLIFFVYTASSTYIQLKSLRNMLTFYTEYRNFFAGIIVLCYITVSVCLFFHRLRLLGFTLAFAIAITLYITIKQTPHYPHDFGGVFNTIQNKYRLVILLLIAAMAGSAILLQFLQKREQRGAMSKSSNPVYS